MLFTDVVNRLEDAFTRELPGSAAQAHLAPIPRRQWPDGFREEQVRHAAGLLLVFPTPLNAELAETAEPVGSWRVPRLPSRSSRPESRPKDGSLSPQAHILLTVRADTLGRHGGQVSLPGGVVDAGETFEQAALREAREEVGLATDLVRVLGALTPLDIPVSGFRLHPIVGVSERRPQLTPAAHEVARILEPAIDALMAPDCVVYARRARDGVAMTVPGFHLEGVEIWGATAMVLAEFLSLLGWSSPRRL
jgi:8-oxo-dGTP pyrophosphatase MutT (NUDIX family)